MVTKDIRFQLHLVPMQNSWDAVTLAFLAAYFLYCEIMHPVELHRDGAFTKHGQMQVRSISRSRIGRIES
jgi:hypothetical protein